MSTPSQLAARVLHVDRRALAVAIADRCEASFANSQRAAWVEAIEVHLDTLAACIEFSSPRLFEDYAGWHRSLPASHTSGSRELETVLGVLEEIIASEFPHESRDVIGRYLQRARNASAAAALQTDTDRATSQLQRAYLQALLAADRDKAQQIIFDAVHRGMPVSEIYRRILQPTQYEVGRLWQTGQISVAQEHFCTSVTQVVISQLQPYFLRRTPSGKSLVATCVGDELHEVGLRFVVDLMEMEG